jgi:hypothetical protein
MIPDHLLFSTGNACKQCGSENLLPGRRQCRACYNEQCRQYRADYPTDPAYFVAYAAKNRLRLREYNREYMRRKRKEAKA